MKKFLYLIRKIFGIIILIFAFIFLITIIFGKQEGRSQIVVETLKIFVFFALFFLGFYIYPFRTKYCSCGRKYTTMNYEYVETKECNSKTKENIKTIPYNYVVNEVYYCEHCNKEYKRSKNIYAGEMIYYLDNGTYEDKKIPFDEALNNFIASQKKKN